MIEDGYFFAGTDEYLCYGSTLLEASLGAYVSLMLGKKIEAHNSLLKKQEF